MAHRAALRLAAVAFASALLGGCNLLGIGPPRAPTTPQPEQIVVGNGTTLDLTLWVNGTQVASVARDGGTTLGPDQLPPMPWTVEARTSSGRVIASFDAKASDLLPVVGVNSTSWTISGDRVDLSCGQLVISAGSIPIVGPPPGTGTPGDCAP
jgi:hypothetical protein